MSKRWHFRWGQKDDRPRQDMPPAQTEVSLPDPAEARQALADSEEGQRRVDQLRREMARTLSGMREARERNHFAEAIIDLIKEGR